MSKKPFRFERGWTDHQKCGDIIREVWTTTRQRETRIGIHDRLGWCQIKQKNWTKTRHLNYRQIIDETYKIQKEIQQKDNKTYDRN